MASFYINYYAPYRTFPSALHLPATSPLTGQKRGEEAGPKARPSSASSHRSRAPSGGGVRGGPKSSASSRDLSGGAREEPGPRGPSPPLAPATPKEGPRPLRRGRGMKVGPKGHPSSASCIGRPIHIPGGRDHYIKGWLQRSPERMVCLWCTCQEHFNPQISGIIHNSIGHQLELKVILVISTFAPLLF